MIHPWRRSRSSIQTPPCILTIHKERQLKTSVDDAREARMHALIIIIATSVESKFLLYDSILRVRRYRVWQIESTLHRFRGAKYPPLGRVTSSTRHRCFWITGVGVIHRCNHTIYHSLNVRDICPNSGCYAENGRGRSSWQRGSRGIY